MADEVKKLKICIVGAGMELISLKRFACGFG
jgi:hypothetical protein